MSCNNSTDFKNLSCKIELKKTLTLSSNKPNIRCIKNVNVDVDILGSKVISTPLNEIVKKENLNLAKERLLIAGWICIKIYYTSSSNNSCINTAFFKMPFNTYIPLNKSANCCKDKFIINSCVKNICATPCNCRSFEQKLTLFLYAKKNGSISPKPIPVTPIAPITPVTPVTLIPPKPTPEPIPEIIMEKLPTSIIISNNSNKEVAKIEFNTTNNLLIITSTEEIPDNTKGTSAYFLLSLQDMITSKIKASASIMSNQTAKEFQNNLNGIAFEEFDTLQLNCLTPSNIKITNYPTLDETYTLTDKMQLFIITPNGLQPFVEPIPPPIPVNDKLPNDIVIQQNIGSDNVNPIAIIEFNILDKKLSVDSTGLIPNPLLTTNFFSFKLKDNTNTNIKANSVIVSNQNADSFANDLNKKDFEYDDILELDYSVSSVVIITNYPNEKENYTPSKGKEYYKITPKGLIAYLLTP